MDKFNENLEQFLTNLSKITNKDYAQHYDFKEPGDKYLQEFYNNCKNLGNDIANKDEIIFSEENTILEHVDFNEIWNSVIISVMTVRIIYISKGDRNIVGSIVYKDNNSIMSSNNTNDNQPLNASDVDALLEKEKLRNKGDVWIKLDKTMRIQRLNDYADTYGKENDMSSKDIRLLRNFFKNCLDKNKLNKAKDVVYNKETRIITSIPALHFNQVTNNFTFKIMDTKRVSTLKSLTPKKHNSMKLDDDQKEKQD